MKNVDVREAIAREAEKRIGMNRFDLEYRCEETCAEGVSDVLRTVFNDNELEGLCTSYSCNTLYVDMTDSEYWYEPEGWMIRGDIILFDWDRIPEEKPLDHVGIVINVDGDIITYANINGSNHNEWTLQTINKHSVCIAYWMRYLNPTPKAETIDIIVEHDNRDIYNKIRDLQQQRESIESQINELILSLCK